MSTVGTGHHDPTIWDSCQPVIAAGTCRHRWTGTTSRVIDDLAARLDRDLGCDRHTGERDLRRLSLAPQFLWTPDWGRMVPKGVQWS